MSHYTVTAAFPYGSTATVYRCTLAQAVEWIAQWLPMSSKVVCLETPDDTGIRE